MRLSGHSRNQETKWSSSFHGLISHPASLRMVVAVTTSMPSTWVRSVPVMRNNSARKANAGLFPFLLTSRPFRTSLGRLAPWLRSSLCWRYCSSCRSHSAICCWQKLITFLLLLQHEQQVFLPVALQIARDLFLARLHPRIRRRVSRRLSLRGPCGSSLRRVCQCLCAQIVNTLPSSYIRAGMPTCFF